ncbi:MAG: 3-isopropylmalate dehydratase small subunit [Chloroflexi bacterium RBG_19FT_COMBO_62_14]|nr:MAG: 3-isopropylmalate dehydratase small subunit [Chloroflexi bacterium RBG_19FT_COMBO_62_14]
MPRFDRLTSHAVALPAQDIDTDQIIPARFLKAVDRSAMGENLFADWRRLPGGSPDPTFPLNRPTSAGAHILLAGNNFGCGSSREHAVWALTGAGFQAVIAESFADIFRNNALKNGLLPVAVPEESIQDLFDRIERDPYTSFTIDLTEQTLSFADLPPVQFEIDPFARRCLLDGVDQLGYLLKHVDRIAEYEAAHGVD